MSEYPKHWGHWGGTAAYPSTEWVRVNQINDLNNRITALENRKTVTVVPQRGGTIVYEHRVVQGD